MSSNNSKERLMADTKVPLTPKTPQAPRQIHKRAISLNRGAVSKAAYPGFVGLTPHDDLALGSTMPSMTSKNKTANADAKRVLTSGNWLKTETR